MSRPLGRMAGHSSEIIECIDVLRGKGPDYLRELSVELSAWMFYLGERSLSVDEGRRLACKMISTGLALEKFRQVIALQGGDARVIDDPSLLPGARSSVDIGSPKSGFIQATNCMQFGIALAMLEAGAEK